MVSTTRRNCGPADDPTADCSCPFKIRVYHVSGTRRMLLPCARRLCPHCGPMHWRPRVLAGLHAGLRGAAPEDFLAILLTAPGDVDAETFNRDASKRWNHFVTLLRREFPGAKLDFWRVAELQERGHVHFHVVLRGLRFLPVERFRAIAVRSGFGRFVGVKRPRDYPGGVHSLGSYFGKYLLKGYQGRIGVTKLATFSRGWRLAWEDRRKASTGEWVFAGGIGSAVCGRQQGRKSPAGVNGPPG